MNRGIVYIVGGAKYARWTLKSVISLRQNGGKSGKLPVHIHFIGNYEHEDIFNSLGCTCIRHYSDKVSHHIHRRFKSLIMEKEIPFDQYVMIDADTFIQGDFFGLFEAIPENGVAGIEDGNFESHLQMAKFLFLKKGKEEARSIVKKLLNVDYGKEDNFPPYFNVGVIGFSVEASRIVGKKLYPLLDELSKSEFYNPHDEQLPMNSIMYNEKIHAVIASPIFNYTRSRMKKNKKSGKHDVLKDDIRIIHNRHYPKEANWVDLSPVETEFKRLMNDI